MVTLTEFLLARIAEDEAMAGAYPEKRWSGGHGGIRLEGSQSSFCVIYDHDAADAVWKHVARHDPARVLAECEAKRQIIELHTPIAVDPDDGDLCRICDGNGKNFYWPCDTLRFLALPYADHPQFDEAWRP